MVDAFVIRSATPDDQAFISEMQYEAFFVPPGESRFPREILDEPNIRMYHAGFGTRPGDIGRLAESDHGEPLGAAWARFVEGYGFVDHDTPELSVAVIAAVRRTGVGTALLESLLGSLPRCSLSTDTRNPALRLYERLGFATVRCDGDWNVVMLRVLPAPDIGAESGGRTGMEAR